MSVRPYFEEEDAQRRSHVYLLVKQDTYGQLAVDEAHWHRRHRYREGEQLWWGEGCVWCTCRRKPRAAHQDISPVFLTPLTARAKIVWLKAMTVKTLLEVA